MNCHQVQSNLSLYLYGELDFASEDQIEDHLSGCALCQLALAREKEWHASMNSAQADLSLNLLQDCREGLSAALQQTEPFQPSFQERVRGFSDGITSAWPARAAAAVLLLTAGFGAGNFAAQRSAGTLNPFAPPAEARLVDPYTHIRDIQAAGNGRVRLVTEEVRENELNGSLTDEPVRRLVLAATRDFEDPGVRVDSVELLNGQSGDDVRDALLASAAHDPNAAVRLKALQGLRGFTQDPQTRQTVIGILQTDADPGVRSQAIDILLPATQTQLTPELMRTMKQLMQDAPPDDYVRARCAMALREASFQVY